jgi:hypothetical protein
MKKIAAVTVLLLSFTFFSCGWGFYNDFHNDITVVNHCDFAIQVYITSSSSRPTAFISIARNSSQVFSEIEDGNYYLHLTAAESGAPFNAKNNYYKDIRINSNRTWIITWRDSEYDISYR